MHIPKVRPHTSPQVVKYTLMGVSENSTPKPGVGCLRDAGDFCAKIKVEERA